MALSTWLDSMIQRINSHGSTFMNELVLDYLSIRFADSTVTPSSSLHSFRDDIRYYAKLPKETNANKIANAIWLARWAGPSKSPQQGLLSTTTSCSKRDSIRGSQHSHSSLLIRPVWSSLLPFSFFTPTSQRYLVYKYLKHGIGADMHLGQISAPYCFASSAQKIARALQNDLQPRGTHTPCDSPVVY